MKKLLVACSTLVLGACAGVPGVGQMIGMGLPMDPTSQTVNSGMAASTAAMQGQGADMMAAMNAAQVAANRPGDEAMTCAAIEAEFGAMFKDPKFVASVASLGASAQAQQQRIQTAQANAAAQTAMSGAMGIAGMLPGGGWLQGGYMQAQMAEAVSQMGQADRERASMISEVTSIMPQVMRGQRLNDLATAKNCAFLQKP